MHLAARVHVEEAHLAEGRLDDLGDKAKVVVSFDAIGFILGLGYVMGLRSSMILCAGGILSNFVLVPLIWFIGSHLPDAAVYPASVPIASTTPSEPSRAHTISPGANS